MSLFPKEQTVKKDLAMKLEMSLRELQRGIRTATNLVTFLGSV